MPGGCCFAERSACAVSWALQAERRRRRLRHVGWLRFRPAPVGIFVARLRSRVQTQDKPKVFDVLCVLNIVTGVFVQRAFRTKMQDEGAMLLEVS